MSDLNALFSPSSIAVVGATERRQSAGNIVFRNLINSGYNGIILPINTKRRSVCGVLAYSSIDKAPIVPELAILCTQSKYNPALIEELGSAGVKAVIIVDSQTSQESQEIELELLESAKRYGMRILGPNSLGLILPWKNLNLSLSPISAQQGSLAFVSQSAAICSTVLDWAKDKQIGFSAFVSVGRGIDIDFADLLDTLALDSKTRAILVYVDSIVDARKFMSAARAASRNRRVLVVKGGRSPEGALAASRHSGLPNTTMDVVFDSAIKRSGMLRVHNTHELFAAVETLTHSVPLRGERLTIVTNGGGPAIMAVDSLSDRGGKLADLSVKLQQRLLSLNVTEASNPIDLGGDATAKRYVDTLTALMDSEETDAILVMHSPTAVVDPLDLATQVLDVVKAHPKRKRYNILTNWTGESSTVGARKKINAEGIPTYRTPESAAVAFMHLVEYRRNQRQLMQTPSSLEGISAEEKVKAEQWLNQQISKGDTHLGPHTAAELFTHYGFDVLPTWHVKDALQASEKASEVGFPIALKIQSKQLSRKSDVHGVQLNLRSQQEVYEAATTMLQRISIEHPDALVDGLIVQAMAPRAGAIELRVRVFTDPVFGPVICVGQGGRQWDVARDASIGLPPLNQALARYLVIGAIQNRHLPQPQFPNAYDIDTLAEFLSKLSQMIIDCRAIEQLDIHPVMLSGKQLTIVDADIQLTLPGDRARARLAIRPYPVELEQSVELKDGRKILLRPIRPEDEPYHGEFIGRVSKEDLYKRFFTEVGELNHEALANLTQIDYDREMAFIAVTADEHNPSIIGVSRLLAEPDKRSSEFAVLVQSDLKGVGLGRLLMEKIIDYGRENGIQEITGMTMPTNRGMIGLSQKLGFDVSVDFEDGTADMRLTL
ncbi:protein acetyltransferase (plasmid) [Vibrio sp. qd031]|uniref:bifunctional acetate--CoA ligase family protein/GNAT family N-acetyltransferase n=1 Tax=Vibrio sp. qd031 TaxID=1603038 RepID=UPI000A10581A|nr:bifunctional acetate--CoA ligase family protein/GNAT family N-acetyltransferase [Vibrio sp. qd031]ORT52509.1 protein acetyltransferase [Vibrio sp. qd031]